MRVSGAQITKVATTAVAVATAAYGVLRFFFFKAEPVDPLFPRSPHASRGWAAWVAKVLTKARCSAKKVASGATLKIHTEGDARLCQNAMIEKPGELGALVGWKCGATTDAAMKAMGTPEPFTAPLFSKFTYSAESPEVLDLGYKETLSKKVEAEFGFRMGKSLPRRRAKYTEEEVWEAVGEVVPAIEFVNSRVEEGKNFYTILADGGVNAATVQGKPVARVDVGSPDSLVDEHVRLIVNKKVVAEGCGGIVFGAPLRSLTWLANHLISRGHCLKEGQLIISGAVVSAEISPGDTVAVLFDTLGSVEVNMVSKMWES